MIIRTAIMNMLMLSASRTNTRSAGVLPAMEEETVKTMEKTNETQAETEKADSADTAEEKAASETDSVDTEEKEAASETDSANTEEEKAVLETDSADTKEEKAASETDSSDTEEEKAVSESVKTDTDAEVEKAEQETVKTESTDSNAEKEEIVTEQIVNNEAEGEDKMKEINMSSDLNVKGLEGLNGETGNMEGMQVNGMGGNAKEPLLSSWPFVLGISFLVLFGSIALGAFLAKLKIRKGIDIYED